MLWIALSNQFKQAGFGFSLARGPRFFVRGERGITFSDPFGELLNKNRKMFITFSLALSNQFKQA
jgi:hypothetical protein